MTRNELAHILGAKPALHGALAQIANLASPRDRDACQSEAPARRPFQHDGECITDESRTKRAENEPAPRLADP